VPTVEDSRGESAAPLFGELTNMASSGRLHRPRHGRWIAGVCAGLGERFGLPAWLTRLLFLLSCLLPGPQFIVYIVLWIMMPEE
jgi:phage shock protein PspC (stress-responsive transcriptional regulator)